MKDNMKMDVFWRWVLSLILPILTLLIGYHTFVIKASVLKDVEEKYVSKQNILAITNIQNLHTDEIQEVSAEIRSLDKNLATLSANQNNAMDLLTEVRADIKQILKRGN